MKEITYGIILLLLMIILIALAICCAWLAAGVVIKIKNRITIMRWRKNGVPKDKAAGFIYICSPYKGNPPYTKDKRAANLKTTAEYCAVVTRNGDVPIAPHLYFSSFLDDENQEDREIGMTMGMAIMTTCREMWVFGNEISEGMKKEISLAHKIGVPIKYFSEQGKGE